MCAVENGNETYGSRANRLQPNTHTVPIKEQDTLWKMNEACERNSYFN